MNDKLFKFLWLTFRKIKNNKFKGAGFCPEKFEYFAFAKQIFDKSIPVNLDLIVRISLLQKLQKFNHFIYIMLVYQTFCFSIQLYYIAMLSLLLNINNYTV